MDGGRVLEGESDSCQAQDPDASLQGTRGLVGPSGSPSGESRQQARLTEVPSASTQGCEVSVRPDGGELSRRGEEELFHETLKQLPVNTLERACQSKQSPQVPLPYRGTEYPKRPF